MVPRAVMAAQAEFFKELKAAWPAVYTSVYLGGLPGQRVSGASYKMRSRPCDGMR